MTFAQDPPKKATLEPAGIRFSDSPERGSIERPADYQSEAAHLETRSTVQDNGANGRQSQAVLDRPISVYSNVSDIKGGVRTVRSFLGDIRDGKNSQQVEKIRSLVEADPDGNKKEVEGRKRALPAATFAGQFERRTNTGLKLPSGILCADVDKLAAGQIAPLKTRLEADKCVISVFLSPTGTGLKILFRIPDNVEFAEAFRSIARYLKADYDVEVDQARKDVCGLCFVSYDPSIVIREDAIPIPVEPSKESTYTVTSSNPVVSSDVTPEDVGDMLRFIPPSPPYDTWIRIISSVASVLPREEALRLLKAWSPEKVEGEYDAKWRSRLSGVNIGTLIFLAKMNGYVPGGAGKGPDAHQEKRPTADLVRNQPVESESVDMGQVDAARDNIFAKAVAKMDSTRIDITHPPPKPRPIYTLAGKVICTPGNITGIFAQAKAGKTAALGAVMAATIGEGETLGFKSENPEGKAVIHFDTEQSPGDHFNVIAIAIRRVGVRIAPPWVRSYSLIGLDPAMRVRLIEFELARASVECGGIHSVILDGVADLCRNPNDLGEAAALVGRLHTWAAHYDSTILAALHLNPKGEAGMTGRGHLGSELERKAETNLVLHKDPDGATTMFTERARHCHIPKNDGPRFAWADDLGLHEGVDSARQTKTDAKAAELRGLASNLFKDGGHFRWTDLIKKIEGSGASERSAQRLVSDLRDGGFIRKNVIGSYESAL